MLIYCFLRSTIDASILTRMGKTAEKIGVIDSGMTVTVTGKITFVDMLKCENQSRV